MTTEALAVRPPRPISLHRVWAWLRHHLLSFYAGLALIYLFLPIAVVVAFSFNNPAGRFNYTWDGFTLNNWLHPFGVPGIGGAIRISLEIALLSSAASTIMGALMALSLARYQFRGRGFAAMLVRTVVDAIRARGDTPFLHAAIDNENAIKLYDALGFATRAIIDVIGARAPR